MITDLALRNNYWHLLCHRTELPELGAFLKLNWLSDEVVIFNDHSDLLVFDNLCPHRGTRFFSELHGNGVVSCPYHGWSFQAGKLHIPCRDKFVSGEINDAKLNILKTQWCGDFLFASVKPLSELEDQLGDCYSILASISLSINGRADFNAYTYECNWKVAVENGLDSLHTPYVHAESLGRLSLSDPENVYHQNNSIAYFNITDASVEKKLRLIKRMFNIADQYDGYQSIYLFPYTMLTSTFGYSYSLQNFFPSSDENKTFFYSRLLKGCLKKNYPASTMDHFFASTAQINRQVFEEDHAICKKIAPQFYDVNSTKFLSVDEEKIIHFRKVLQAI